MTVLLFATTTGYQTRAFEQAAAALGIDLIYATDRCHALDDPWRDRAIAVQFHEEEAGLEAVIAATRGAGRAIDGVLAVGDRPVTLAARAARELGVPWHNIAGVRASRSKLLTRGCLLAAELPVPWFFSAPLDATVSDVAPRLRFPCVLKPLGLSASRGVMRADTVEQFEASLDRLRDLLRRPEIRALREPVHDDVLIEGFIEGREYALEGVLEQGALRVLAIFDKPDPLDGPFFEETIYVTPTALSSDAARRMAGTIAHAAIVMGLRHGPIHAECRINDAGVFVLEIAARPIGGLCARALRFGNATRGGLTLEEILLHHATGGSLDGYGREAGASGVMMVPIPRRGYFKGVSGVEQAARVTGIDQVVITAKPDQLIEPLPEGASYVGFIFARADEPAAVTQALRDAHTSLTFAIDPAPALTRE
jgi:biotin carboxylase